MIGRSPGDFLVVVLGTAILVASFGVGIAQSYGADLLPDREVCWSRLVLGRPCPGCGLTRSFVAAARGDIPRASAWNPAGPPLFALVAAVTLLHGLRLAGAALPWLGWLDIVAAAAAAGVLLARAWTFFATGPPPGV
ncbi:MAG: DUF2752 domain-containing protein [Thermoanaerobaculia bacterium]